MRKTLSTTLAGLFLAVPLFACSSEREDEAAASDDAAMSAAESACSGGKYGEALAYYKAAVAGAKIHARDAYCNGDDGATLYEIGVNAQKAVSTCGAFEDVIKTSPYAGELRQELGRSFLYPIVTGELDPSTWRTLSTALGGVKVYGPAPGAYGNMSALSFEENGRGFIELLNLPEDGSEPFWSRTDMRWSVEHRDGNTFVKFVAEYEDETEEVHELLLKTEELDGVPRYFLELQGEPDAPQTLQRFEVFPSECEA